MSTTIWQNVAVNFTNLRLRHALRRGGLLVGTFLLLAFLVLNVIAYRQARAMTHYTTDREATPKLETLSAFGKAKVLLLGAQSPRPSNRKTPLDFGLEFEVIRLTGAHGLPLEAWFVPHAQARGIVLLFHGHASSKASLLAASKSFHEMGFEALLVDFYGSGGSGGAENSVGYHEAADVAAACAWAGSKHGPVILYGVSMGATAILRAVDLHQAQPAALVLECPFDRLVNTVGNRFRMMGLPAFPFAQLLVFWGGVQQDIDGFALCPTDYARSVRCPTLLMAGEADRRVAVADTRSVYANLSGPKSLKLFPGLGHESYLAARPEEWQATVGAFLDQSLRRSAEAPTTDSYRRQPAGASVELSQGRERF